MKHATADKTTGKIRKHQESARSEGRTVDRLHETGHYVEPAHAASRYDAGNGQGTVAKWPEGKTLEHPVLDGSTQAPRAEHDVDNPWRGLDDPALIRHPWWKRTGKRRWFWE